MDEVSTFNDIDSFDDMANEPVAEDSDANQSIESFDKA